MDTSEDTVDVADVINLLIVSSWCYDASLWYVTHGRSCPVGLFLKVETAMPLEIWKELPARKPLVRFTECFQQAVEI